MLVVLFDSVNSLAKGLTKLFQTVKVGAPPSGLITPPPPPLPGQPSAGGFPPYEPSLAQGLFLLKGGFSLLLLLVWGGQALGFWKKIRRLRKHFIFTETQSLNVTAGTWVVELLLAAL